jgi:two-component system, LytTR family, response regulator AlgR
MMPRLFIVDDEAPARARLTTLLSDIAADCPHQVVGEAAHAQQALDGIAAVRPDIVLLDVQMPGMNGLEMAAHLSAAAAQGEAAPSVIFISAYDEYALQAFEVHALDYLLKPVRAERLAQAIRRVCDLRMRQQTQNAAIAAVATALKVQRRHFSIQERGRLLLVPVTDVLYLKAEAKYVTLRTKTREYLLEESLNSIEDELAASFIRVHRNALVARSAILGVERAVSIADADCGHAAEKQEKHDKMHEVWQVILRDIDERLPVSRRQWPAVRALVK